MTDLTPPDIPWSMKIVGVILCVAISVGVTAGWEWFGDLRDQAAQVDECRP